MQRGIQMVLRNADRTGPRVKGHNYREHSKRVPTQYLTLSVVNTSWLRSSLNSITRNASVPQSNLLDLRSSRFQIHT